MVLASFLFTAYQYGHIKGYGEGLSYNMGYEQIFKKVMSRVTQKVIGRLTGWLVEIGLSRVSLDGQMLRALYTTSKTYGANVVIGGTLPTSEEEINQFKEKVQRAHEMGVRRYFAMTYFICHTVLHKFLAANISLLQALCVDIAGDSIVVPWLEGEKGAPFRTHAGPIYWSCTNNPVFREFQRNLVTWAMQAGADGLVINDHWGTAGSVYCGGCFCDYCVAGFREYLKNKYTTAELKEMGIEDIASFDYREMVRRIARTRNVYIIALNRGEIPLSEEYCTYQLEAAAAFVKELGDMAKGLGGSNVLIGANAQIYNPRDLVDSRYVDFYASETVIEGPPPQEGFASLTFVFKLSEALGKPIYVRPLPSEGGWNYVKNGKWHLVQLWISLSYALGNSLECPL